MVREKVKGRFRLFTVKSLFAVGRENVQDA